MIRDHTEFSLVTSWLAFSCETVGFSQNEGLQNRFAVWLSSDWNATKRSKDGSMVRPLPIRTYGQVLPASFTEDPKNYKLRLLFRFWRTAVYLVMAVNVLSDR